MGTARRVFKLIILIVSLFPLLSWVTYILWDLLQFHECQRGDIENGLIQTISWCGFVWFLYLVFLIFFVWPWEKEGTTKSDTAQEPSDTKAK